MDILWTRPPCRFQLNRIRDVSGVSGVGIVASGIEWPDGSCALRFHTEERGFINYEAPDGMGRVERLHGHGGATVIEWIDQRAPRGLQTWDRKEA